MIANGRRVFLPDAAREHDRQHGQDARRDCRDQARHEREDDCEHHARLFGRGSLLGCYDPTGRSAVLLWQAPARRCRRPSSSGAAPPTASGMRLRRGQVVGERVRDLLDRPERLAGAVEHRVRARRVALGRGEQRGRGRDRQILRGGGRASARSPRAGGRASWRARRAAASPPGTRRWPCGRAPCAPPARAARSSGPGSDPARRAGPRRSRAAGCARPARGPSPTAAPGVDEGDEVVEARAVDGHPDPVGERHQAQAAVRVLGGAGEEELLERGLARARGQLLEQRDAVVEPGLPPGDARPEALLLLVEVARVDALPLALDDGEAAVHVRRDRDEPRRRLELAAGAPLRRGGAGRA